MTRLHITAAALLVLAARDARLRAEPRRPDPARAVAD